MALWWWRSTALLLAVVRIGEPTSDLCGRSCVLTVHKFFVDREHPLRAPPAKTLELFGATRRDLLAQAEGRCNVTLRLWSYAEALPEIAAHDAELAALVERVNVRDYPALVADVARYAIVYRHGGAYQDVAMVFRSSDALCRFAALARRYDGVFVKRVLPKQHKAVTDAPLVLNPHAPCGVVPAPACAGDGPPAPDAAAALERCQRNVLCVGVDTGNGWAACGETARTSDKAACVRFARANPAVDDPVIVNNNFGARWPGLPALREALAIAKGRLRDALVRFDAGRLAPDASASTLFAIGSGSLSAAVLGKGAEAVPLRGTTTARRADSALALTHLDLFRRHTALYQAYNGGSGMENHWAKLKRPLFTAAPPPPHGPEGAAAAAPCGPESAAAPPPEARTRSGTGLLVFAAGLAAGAAASRRLR